MTQVEAEPLRYRRVLGEPVDGAGRPEPENLDVAGRRDGRSYLMSDELRLAVDIALTTSRPLLLRGAPGSGKSSLAPFVARTLHYRYYETTVTATTRAQDLLWRFDVVRRLSDAQVRGDAPARSDTDYVEPGVLWWAFAPSSAALRGGTSARRALDPGVTWGDDPPGGAVVLVDEVDKADPDFPNALLEPLSLNRFTVAETGATVDRHAADPGDPPGLLIVITTNEERDLPPAFLRRCIMFELEHPAHPRLVEIAELHFGPDESGLYQELAGRVIDMRAAAERERLRAPSTAEFLDAIRACRELGIRPDASREWQVLAMATLDKHGSRPFGWR